MALTRDQFLGMVDIEIKKLVVPTKIKKWGGMEVCIRLLTRGDQDTYLKMVNGENKIVNGVREIHPTNFYGHDAWLCSRGACDEQGNRLFTPEDVAVINEKSGEFVGWLGREILLYSDMLADAKDAKKAASVKDELKN